MRSPSGLAVGSSRGCAPTANRIASASTVCSDPSGRDTWTVRLSTRRPSPMMMRTPARSKVVRISPDCSLARSSKRWLTTEKSVTAESSPSTWTPKVSACFTRRTASAVAIKVFDGTTSVSTAEPPMPARSTTVTLAPSWAAPMAASYPPGPPPRITNRVASFLRSALTDTIVHHGRILRTSSPQEVWRDFGCEALVSPDKAPRGR